MKYWLVKSEPEKYSWEQFEKDGKTFWDGVRNYAARNNLREMKKGDKVLYYHSNEGKEIVGYAQVIKEHYQDPTTDEAAWVSVDLKPVKRFKRPVTLTQIKSDKMLTALPLIKQTRLSVMPVGEYEFHHILDLGGITK